MTKPVRPGNPFVGLRPFESDESHLFFGRDQQSVELMQRLHHHGFVGVLGSSGCGKSSLIRAGLIPKLKAGFLVDERDRWIVAVMKPGDAPLTNLALALVSLRIDGTAGHEPGALLKEVEIAGPRAVRELLSTGLEKSDSNLLLLVDQFEEIFRFGDGRYTNRPTNEAAEFVGILLDLASRKELPAYVVLTMRSDFLGDCDTFHGLPEALNVSQYLVPRLTRAQLRAAIEGPIKLSGAAINPALVDHILNHIGDERDQLPVLQHALMRTWQFWQSDGRIPIDREHYERAGTLTDALSNSADEAIEGMSSEQLEVTKIMFRALTDTDRSNRRVRRPAYATEIEAITSVSRDLILDIVGRFQSDGRSFLVCSGDARASNLLLDVSHESLIRQWGMLRDWVDEEKDSRDNYQRLVERASRQGQEGFLRDPALQVMLEWRFRFRPSAAWAARYEGDFESAMRFLDESEGAREKERLEQDARERQVKAASRLRKGLAFVITLVVVLGVAVGIAIKQAFRASQEARRANSSRLALHALSHMEGELDLAMLWSAEALRVEDTFEAESSLVTVLNQSPQLSRFLHGHQQAVQAVAFLDRGKRLVTGGRDGKLIFWDLETGEPTVLEAHRGWVQSLAVSRDGERLATAGRDGTMVLWDMGGQRILKLPTGKQLDVLSVAFVSGGRRLASGGRDGSILLWDLETRDSVELARDLGDVSSLASSPIGDLLASGGHVSGRVMLWDVGLRKPIARLEKHTSQVQGLSFSPDGKLLASGGDDKTVWIWDVSKRDPIRSFSDQRAAVKSVAFSPDGRFLAWGSDDKTIRVWELANTKPLRLLTGHGSFVQAVAFSPDGKHLASGAFDNKVILWELDVQQLVTDQIQAGDAVKRIAFMADGNLVTLNKKGSIAMWDPDTLQPLTAPTISMSEEVTDVIVLPDGAALVRAGAIEVRSDGNEGCNLPISDGAEVKSAAVSGNGRFLAFGINHKNTNQIFFSDLTSCAQVGQLEQAAAVTSVALNSDGGLAAFARDNDIVLWDVRAGNEFGRLAGREASVQSVTFSPDGKRIASVTFDDSISLWDVESRQRLGPPLTGQRLVESLAFSHDGKRLASGSDDGSIYLWDVSPLSWQERACEAANRALPEEEWSAIAGRETPFHPVCPAHPASRPVNENELERR